MKMFLAITVLAAAAVTSSCRKDSSVKPMAPKKDSVALKAKVIPKPASAKYDYQKAIMAKRTTAMMKPAVSQ